MSEVIIKCTICINLDLSNEHSETHLMTISYKCETERGFVLCVPRRERTREGVQDSKYCVCFDWLDSFAARLHSSSLHSFVLTLISSHSLSEFLSISPRQTTGVGDTSNTNSTHFFVTLMLYVLLPSFHSLPFSLILLTFSLSHAVSPASMHCVFCVF